MQTGEGEGPAWGKFWLSLDNESDSMISGETGHRSAHAPAHRSLVSPDILHRPLPERVDSVQPHESASHNGDESPIEELDLPIPDTPFPFKFKAPSGRVHRLQISPSAGITELIHQVVSKLSAEVDSVGGEPAIEGGKLGKSGFALSYLDNEGDTVSITTDQDLLDAVTLSKQNRREKVDLFVHDPEKPPMTATIDPFPVLSRPLTPPESSVQGRHKEVFDESNKETPQGKVRRPVTSQTKPTNEQLVPGVPNDLLLPGAIVTLAVVIVGVFSFSRSGR